MLAGSALILAISGCGGAASRPEVPTPLPVDTATIETTAIDSATRDSVATDSSVPGGTADTCLAGTAAAGAPDTFRIFLGQSVHAARAPVPSNAAEHLIFHQLYPTLLTVDCAERLQRGLATTWAEVAGGVWRIGLDPAARFADGTPLRARDVVASWRAVMIGRTIPGEGIEDVAIEDSTTLVLRLDSTRAAPAMLADARLAPIRRVGTRWPVGAGGYRVTGDAGGTIIATPTAGSPVLVYRVERGDVRDALDAPAGNGSPDLVVTAAPAMLEYAATLSAFDTIPLTWDRTYLLLAPRVVEGQGRRGSSASFRASLAREAVHAEARGASAAGCAGADTSAVPALRPGRLLYVAEDTIASDLAGRLSALASDVSTVSAVGVSAETVADSLDAGGAAGYIIATDRTTGGCRALDVPAGYAIFPLIDIRARAVLRRGVAALQVEAGGPTLVFQHPRGTLEPEPR